jgi:hypothetical protein
LVHASGPRHMHMTATTIDLPTDSTNRCCDGGNEAVASSAAKQQCGRGRPPCGGHISGRGTMMIKQHFLLGLTQRLAAVVLLLLAGPPGNGGGCGGLLRVSAAATWANCPASGAVRLIWDGSSNPFGGTCAGEFVDPAMRWFRPVSATWNGYPQWQIASPDCKGGIGKWALRKLNPQNLGLQTTVWHQAESHPSGWLKWWLEPGLKLPLSTKTVSIPVKHGYFSPRVTTHTTVRLECCSDSKRATGEGASMQCTCDAVNYEYTFGDWSDPGCGMEQFRTEAETCGAAAGCSCSGRRTTETENRAGSCCTVNYGYTFGGWSTNCGTQTRSEQESCAAAPGCSCSGRRTAKTEYAAGPCCTVN